MEGMKSSCPRALRSALINFSKVYFMTGPSERCLFSLHDFDYGVKTEMRRNGIRGERVEGTSVTEDCVFLSS